MTNPPTNVKFEKRPQPQLNEGYKSFDVVTTTFVNHHIFPNEEFVAFLEKVAFVGKQTFIFNDYYRSLKNIILNDIQLLSLKYIGINNLINLATYIPSFSLLYSIREDIFERLNMLKSVFYDNRAGFDLVVDGGLLSMRRAFSYEEYVEYFKLAGYPEGALTCKTLNKWYEITETCRVVCSADLSWFSLH